MLDGCSAHFCEGRLRVRRLSSEVGGKIKTRWDEEKDGGGLMMTKYIKKK